MGPGTTGIAKGRIRSGSVFGVDLHVLVGQVGGPDGLAAISTSEFDTDGDFLTGHYRRALLFRVAGRAPALAGDADLAKEHIDLAHVQVWHAGVPDRSENAAPVRVGGEQRGLEDRKSTRLNSSH